jgi:hypothetical protein
MAKKTDDEKFLIKVYETVKVGGDCYAEVDPYEVGRGIGQRERRVRAMVALLLRSNFLKKASDDRVALTQKGVGLVEDLLSSSEMLCKR